MERRLYELADVLRAQYQRRQFHVVGWGVGRQLELLSSGRLPIRETSLADSQHARRLERLIRDPVNVFITPLFGQSPEEALTALDRAAVEACMTRRTFRTISDRRARPTYAIVEFQPGQCSE